MKKKTVVMIACICLALIIAGAAITLYVVMNKKKPKEAKDAAVPETVVATAAPQGSDLPSGSR